MALSALERAVLSKRFARYPLAGILFPALGHGGGKQQFLSPVGAGDLRTWREGRPAGVRFAVNASPLLFQLLPRWKVDAERIRNLPGAGDVYAYFDNDQAAYAMQDALELSALLRPNAGL